MLTDYWLSCLLMTLSFPDVALARDPFYTTYFDYVPGKKKTSNMRRYAIICGYSRIYSNTWVDMYRFQSDAAKGGVRYRLSQLALSKTNLVEYTRQLGRHL